MTDNRGQYYSEGHCIASGEDCNNELQGACGVCRTGQLYRELTNQLASKDPGLAKHLCETP